MYVTGLLGACGPLGLRLWHGSRPIIDIGARLPPPSLQGTPLTLISTPIILFLCFLNNNPRSLFSLSSSHLLLFCYFLILIKTLHFLLIHMMVPYIIWTYSILFRLMWTTIMIILCQFRLSKCQKFPAWIASRRIRVPLSDKKQEEKCQNKVCQG